MRDTRQSNEALFLCPNFNDGPCAALLTGAHRPIVISAENRIQFIISDFKRTISELNDQYYDEGDLYWKE